MSVAYQELRFRNAPDKHNNIVILKMLFLCPFFLMIRKEAYSTVTDLAKFRG